MLKVCGLDPWLLQLQVIDTEWTRQSTNGADGPVLGKMLFSGTGAHTVTLNGVWSLIALWESLLQPVRCTDAAPFLG